MYCLERGASMNEQIQANQIQLLENQIKKYKRDIYLTKRANKEYFQLLQNLMNLLAEKDNESLNTTSKDQLSSQQFKLIKEDLNLLHDSMKQLQKELREVKELVSQIPQAIKAQASDLLARETESRSTITFRELQSATGVQSGGSKPRGWNSTSSNYANTSHQVNTPPKIGKVNAVSEETKKADQETIKKESEKEIEEKARKVEKSAEEEKGKSSLSLFKWKL